MYYFLATLCVVVSLLNIPSSTNSLSAEPYGHQICDFVLNGTETINPSDLPAECQNMSQDNRAHWVRENGKFDEFFAKLDDVEQKLGFHSEDHENNTLKWAMRMQMYEELAVFEENELCRKKPGLLEFANCLIAVKDKMIVWLDEFYHNHTTSPN